MVLAVVALAVVAIVTATITGQFMTARRLLDQRHRQIQAEWLARAGVELAAARLLSEPTGYEGETVELIPEAEVHIAVRPETGVPGGFRVLSDARFPGRGAHVVLRSCSRLLRRTQRGNDVRIEVGPGTPSVLPNGDPFWW
jgi:hypothetical protein